MTTPARAGQFRASLSADRLVALRAYLRRGLRRAISAVPDADIDDFVQEALLRVVGNLDSFRGDSRLDTWAMAIALRVAFGALRRRRHAERDLDANVERNVVAVPECAAGPDPARDSERRDLAATLRSAIAEVLTERQRLAVVGELEGIPSEALAERLGINRNALYKLHHDARKKLKTAIAAAGFSDLDVQQTLRGE